MRRLSILPILVAVLSSGCGPSGPKIVPVTGTLSLNGEPFEGASITFAPAQANAFNTPGGAMSGPGGSYVARSSDLDGLSTGEYKVLVTKISLKNGAKIPDEYKDDPRNPMAKTTKTAGSGH